MAITRCPYCHAIIDEADKYCNNCGTQLLFSEDEEIEEEIPGEKIVDAEVEEKDYTIDEPGSEKRPVPAKDLDAEIDEELEENLPEGTGRTAIEELMAGADLEDEEHDPTEEVILVDEIEASEAESVPGGLNPPPPEILVEAGTGPEEPEGEDEEAEEEEIADELEVDLEDEIEEVPVQAPESVAPAIPEEETREYGRVAAPAAEKPVEAPACAPDEPEIEYVVESPVEDEAATAGEASLRPATFDSQELENLGRTVELGREKIDKFIEVMAAKTVETGPLPAPPTPQPEPPSETVAEPEPETEAAPPSPPAPVRSPEPPPTGTLPPWATSMRGAPTFLDDTGPVEPGRVRGEPATAGTEEVEIFPRRRGSDSTIGLPEKINQAPLPFERPQPAEEDEEEPVEERTEDEAFEEGQEAAEEDREISEPVSEAPAAAEPPARPLREPLLPVRDAEPGRLAAAEILPADELEGAAPRPPFSISVFFKSKVFDLLFVGLFWLVALWLAAAAMDVTLFDVLGAMSGSMLMLYATFVLLYFFLFKFFLGETIGDRLFRPRE